VRWERLRAGNPRDIIAAASMARTSRERQALATWASAGRSRAAVESDAGEGAIS